MATVRFSNSLKNEILHNARVMFSKRISDAEKNIPTEWDSQVYDKMFQDTLTTMNLLPAEYFSADDNLVIHEMKWDGMPDMVVRSITVELPSSRCFPNLIRAEKHGLMSNKEGRYSHFTLNGNDPRWEYLKASYTTYCQDIQTVFNERDSFLIGVGAVLGTFATLAPALKEWPALWGLLDEDIKNRHREVVERKKRTVSVHGDNSEQAVDLDRMTAAVAVSRITR